MDKGEKVHFVYLGDLFETAIGLARSNIKNGIMKSEYPDEDFLKRYKIVLGDLSMIFFKKTSTGQYIVSERKEFPLAKLPIALDKFHEWFYRKIVRPQRETFYLGEFVDTVISELVIGSITPQLSGHVHNVKLRGGLKVEIFTAATNTIKNVNSTNIRSFIKTSEDRLFSSVKDETTFFYIYGTTYADNNFSNDFRIDVLENNIPWFYIGRDRGLLKSIQFERDDQPYARIARHNRAEVEEQSPIGIWRDKYNATLRMIGNNLLYPGQNIYIHPLLLGAGGGTAENQEVMEALGIGGYYDVITVDSSIVPNNFETITKCVWVSSGKSKSRSVHLENCNK